MATLCTKVELFYDVISPYSWLAFEVLCRYRPHWNMKLVLRPCYLGGIMKESGNRPPMVIPSKGLYMNHDLIRNARYHQVPLKLMEDPFTIMVEKGSLRAQRFLTAINLHVPEHLEDVSRSLWTRVWSKEEDIVDNESLALAAENAKVPGNAIENCLKLINEPIVKENLKKTTEEVVEYGAFGAPTIIVHTKSGPEMFFGSDRFPLIAEMLKETWKGPLPELQSNL